ncbi:hypothetical protein BCEN4_520069 [Burkholderia cenocepacia]|nr:hypothetical protein BCEN4_520069 [Burkholderia cenocepacia]
MRRSRCWRSVWFAPVRHAWRPPTGWRAGRPDRRRGGPIAASVSGGMLPWLALPADVCFDALF